MHFNNLQALFAGSILTLAFATSAYSAPPSPPVPVSPPVLSTATPTITANLANPIISSQFQLGVNNGLRTLCLGPQSSNQLPENHASTASPSQALTSIMQQLQPSSAATAAGSLSTVTQVTTEATAYKTELLKMSTVTAWIDVLSFLNVGGGTQTGTSLGARASLGIEERARENEEIVVTVTRTQLATQTAVVKEVAVTALIYVLSYPDPSLTDAPDTTADPNPAPTSVRAGNGTNVSQNPTNQQAVSQYQAEMLQAFKDGYELGKGMENPCIPAPAPAVGTVGKREDVWKDLGDGVLDVLGVGPDVTRSKHKFRRQDRDGLEKRVGGGHGSGSGSGSGGGHGGGHAGGSRGGGSAGTAPIIVVSGTLSPTHTTALHNLWITALVIGFLALRAGASTAGFSDNSSSAISTSIGPKASNPSEPLPSNSSTIITNTSRSPTDLRLDSLTRLENRGGGGSAAAARAAARAAAKAAARAAAANSNSGATVRPSTPPVRILLVVALLFVLFTTRVTAGTIAGVGSGVVDNLAITRQASATVPETLKSREVSPVSTEANTAPTSLRRSLENSDEGKKRFKGGCFSSTATRPSSMAPTRWVFWIIMLVTSLTTFGANATHMNSGINSTAVTEPDKFPPRFASRNQSPHHETKRITNKSSTPFITARQPLSGGGYDITPDNVNGPGYHIEPNQLCSADYNYNCGDASSAAELPIKLALLPLYFLFGWGFVGAAGSAITTTRDTTDILDLEDSSPTYPPSTICITTTLLLAFVSGTGSPDTDMNARNTKTTNARPTETKNARPIKHVRFLLPNQRRSSSAEEKQRTCFMQDLNRATRRPRSYSASNPPTPLTPRHHTSSILTTPLNGRTTKPKPKDNANRRPRSYPAPIPRSILTTASIALVFAVSIGGCTALPSLAAPEASSTISLPTHVLRSVDTGLPSSTALAHREEQAKNVQDSDNREKQNCYHGCPQSSSPKARSTSLIWPFLPLLLMLLGCTASATSISMEASSISSHSNYPLSPTTSTKLAAFTVSASDQGQAKRAQDSDIEKRHGHSNAWNCGQCQPHPTSEACGRCDRSLLSSSPKACSTSLIWSSLPLLLVLLSYISRAIASTTISALELLSTNSTQPCEDGLDPSPTGAPPNAINAINDQQAGTLQAAQVAEGFPVTPETTSNTTDTPIVRRAATGATLHQPSKAARSRIPSLRLLFGILALFFTTQTSALTLGSSAMARRALPDIHARSNLPERPATEPEPVPVILSRTLEMSETVVSRSDSYFEYCVQMTDEDAKEDCYEYISVEYGLERSETVAFRSESRLDGWVTISDEEEEGEGEGEKGCLEDIDDGVEGVSDEAVHGNLAVRSTTAPVSHPRKLKRSNPTASGSDPGHCKSLDTAEARDKCLCRQAPTEEKRDNCLQVMNDRYEGANPDAGRRDLAARSTTEPSENLASRDYSPDQTCAQMTNEEDQENCYGGMSNGPEGTNPDAGRRNLAARSTPTPMPGPTPITHPSTPDTPQMTDAELICNSQHTQEAREACLASAAGPSRNFPPVVAPQGAKKRNLRRRDGDHDSNPHASPAASATPPVVSPIEGTDSEIATEVQNEKRHEYDDTASEEGHSPKTFVIVVVVCVVVMFLIIGLVVCHKIRKNRRERNGG